MPLKKRKPRFNPKSLKIEKKNEIVISGWYSFSSIWYIGRSECSADTWIVALLWKLPQMPSCSANNANLDKNNFDMFYKIDCSAASMAEYEWTMYQMKVE